MLSIKKSDYNAVARTINKMLPYGKVTVIDTSDVDPMYCSKWSMAIDDTLYDMLYERQDAQSSMIIFDNTFAVGSEDFYIEPYNHRLLNLAC